jgi:hypothetical protein
MGAVSVAYFAVNIGYFSVVAKKDVVDGRRIVAALFFRNLWGEDVERVSVSNRVFFVLIFISGVESGDCIICSRKYFEWAVCARERFVVYLQMLKVSRFAQTPQSYKN